MVRRGRLRGFMLVWALLQLALPGVASSADAMLDRAGAENRTAHAEATRSATCPLAHAADCALCQLAQRVGAPLARAGRVGTAARESAPRELAVAAAGAVDRCLLAQPRAPPRA